MYLAVFLKNHTAGSSFSFPLLDTACACVAGKVLCCVPFMTPAALRDLHSQQLHWRWQQWYWTSQLADMKWTERNRAAGVLECVHVCMCVLLYMNSQMKLCLARQHQGHWEWASKWAWRSKEKRGACLGRNEFLPGNPPQMFSYRPFFVCVTPSHADIKHFLPSSTTPPSSLFTWIHLSRAGLFC